MKKILFSVLFVFLILGFLTYQKSSLNQSVNPPINAVEEAPQPSATPVIPSQISPDGKYTVSVRKEGIFVNDILSIPNTKYPEGEFLTHFNSWSPNDKYFFLIQKIGDNHNYLVFKADGSPMYQDLNYLNVNQYFAEAYPEYKLVDVTGWASPFLVVTNAEDSTGNKMSYWFDITTRHFIRLSSYFE